MQKCNLILTCQNGSLKKVGYFVRQNAVYKYIENKGYSRCQFAYFIQYGLMVLLRKEYKLKDVDVGSLMHFIIEQFSLDVQQHKGGWKELDKEYAYKKVDKLCEIALTEYLGDEQLRKARFISFY